MMADEEIIGIWRGPFPGQLANGGTVAYGQKAVVTEADLESGHWDTSRAQNPTISDPPPLPPPAPTSALDEAQGANS